MAAVVLQVRLAEIRTRFRGGAAAARMVARLAVCMVLGGVLWWGAGVVSGTPAPTAAAVGVVSGAAAMAAFALMSLAASPSGARDPRSFAVFGLPLPALAAGTLAAQVLSVRCVVLALGATATVRLWLATGATAAAAAVGALLGMLACVVIGGCCALARDRRAGARASRASTVLGAAVGIGIPVAAGLAGATGVAATALRSISRALAVTPLGAAWALPLAGRVVPAETPAGAPAVLAALTVVAAAAVFVGLAATRTAPRRPRRAAVRRSRWFAVLPGTPSGVIAARSLVYWLHDGRYLAGMLIVPVVAAAAVVPPLVAGRLSASSCSCPRSWRRCSSAGFRTTMSRTTPGHCGCTWPVPFAVPQTGSGAWCRR